MQSHLPQQNFDWAQDQLLKPHTDIDKVLTYSITLRLTVNTTDCPYIIFCPIIATIMNIIQLRSRLVGSFRDTIQDRFISTGRIHSVSAKNSQMNLMRSDLLNKNSSMMSSNGIFAQIISPTVSQEFLGPSQPEEEGQHYRLPV